MPLVPVSIAALTIAVIFYIWRRYDRDRRREFALLHQRVALMLWITAGISDSLRNGYQYDEVASI
jgi:hypothetical protein